MIIGIHSIIVFYEHFYQKKYNSLKYKFQPSTQAIVKIQNFLKFLDKQYDLNTLGVKFLSNYFVFQFNRTHDQVFQRYASKYGVAGRIQIYDIIGKKAFQYWLDRNIDFDFSFQLCDFIKDHNISLLSVQKLLESKEIKTSILQSEEIEKQRFLNTSRGFLNCIEHTSLYNHYSYNCARCINKIDCKKMLKSNYKDIYIERGYGASSH